MFKEDKIMGRCDGLYPSPGDNIGVSWTPTCIRRHHNRHVEFTWSVDGPETGHWGASLPAHPWDRDSPPIGPLWDVVELCVIDSVSVLDTFPTGKYTILSYTQL